MNAETIFVSYSSKDRPFVLALVEELKKLGAKMWIDQLDIDLGENWDNAIEEALEKSGAIMIIISPTSVESQNVQDEVSIAISTKKKMVPILIKSCELPMRWGRRQYADLANNPDKAIHDVLHFLGLQDKAASSIKKLLSLVGVSEAPKKVVQETADKKGDDEVALEDLLISEEEIDKVALFHKKAIKKNKLLMGLVVLGSVVLFLLLQYVVKISQENFTITLIGCLALLCLTIIPYLNINKRVRTLELLDLLKLKRDRLTRIINRLSGDDIENFNNEFNHYIAI